MLVAPPFSLHHHDRIVQGFCVVTKEPGQIWEEVRNEEETTTTQRRNTLSRGVVNTSTDTNAFQKTRVACLSGPPETEPE